MSKIDHPDYYNQGIEAIDYIDSHNFDFCLGNAVKYITRAGHKTDDATEDLEKAIWYLQHKLSLMQSLKKSNQRPLRD